MSTSTQPAFSVEQIGQICISVSDIDRATAFYRDVLGLPLLFAAGSMSFFQAGSVRLMLSLPDRPEFEPPGSILYYKVADLDSAFATLSARGAKVEAPPRLIARMPDHELWMAAFRDSEGNFFELMHEKR